MYSNGKFRFMRVESEDLKRAIYRLRYQIYVEEFGFERPEDHPCDLEVDPYDAHAIYMAALDATEQVVGTARLILHSKDGFPIEHAVNLQYSGEKPPPERTAEISRLAVASSYRRRAEDGQYGVESYLKVSQGGVLPDIGVIPEEYARRQRPAIMLGLCALIWQTSKRLGLTHWYMISEKKLWNTLYKYGMLFHQIGEPVEYHGIRIPYMIPLAEFEDHLRCANPPLYATFLSGLEAEYHPKVTDFSVSLSEVLTTQGNRRRARILANLVS
jgi:N-acyl amino acid synthase of PEP-CTERM/exosortase system